MENTRCTAAIVFLPREGETPTLMLEPILFDPAAVWLRESLRRLGVERFLVACHKDDRDRAAQCFPEDTVFVTTGASAAREELQIFLLETPDQVMVITEPVFLLDGPAPAGESGEGVHLLPEVNRQTVLAGGDLFEELKKLGPAKLPGAVRVDRESLLETLPALAKRQTVRRLWEAGVRFVDPGRVCIAPTVSVGAGTAILPGTILRGDTHIGEHCEIGPNTVLRDVRVGDRTLVNASQGMECSIGSDTTVGPFAYLRPDTTVGSHVRVGDFVELKNSVIGDETKISHLAYLGDCDVGEGSDIGCGTVTVNYDGAHKFRTVIGDGAFIGCNTNLVAPVSVGRGAYVAAGSTITRDVPSESLAIARSQQTVKNQWVKKRQNRQK